MITDKDIIRVDLTPEQRQMAKTFAVQKSRGGVSRTRTNKAERDKYLYRDNLVGCVGEVALTVYLFGSTFMYRLSQLILSAHENFNLGDGGFDIPGLNIDIKSTFYTGRSRSMLDYHLIVNRKEFKPDWNYVFCLVEGNENNFADVYLMGWLYSSELRRMNTNHFKGAYSVTAENLMPLPKFRWYL